MAAIKFGANLRHLRELSDLKQIDMHSCIGFSQSTWNNYEKGNSNPNLDDFIKISNYFGVLESDLLRVEIPESDILQLYENYISAQEQPFELEDSPRSKSFMRYITARHITIPFTQKQENVSPDIKKPKKMTDYPVHSGHEMSLKAAEPPVVYGSKNEQTTLETLEARIAFIEQLLKYKK